MIIRIDEWPVEQTDIRDPRKIKITAYGFPVYALTSLSWLLPVELNEDGSIVKHIHYDKIISPRFTSQEYGIEDPRISVNRRPVLHDNLLHEF